MITKEQKAWIDGHASNILKSIKAGADAGDAMDKQVYDDLQNFMGDADSKSDEQFMADLATFFNIELEDDSFPLGDNFSKMTNGAIIPFNLDNVKVVKQATPKDEHIPTIDDVLADAAAKNKDDNKNTVKLRKNDGNNSKDRMAAGWTGDGLDDKLQKMIAVSGGVTKILASIAMAIINFVGITYVKATSGRQWSQFFKSLTPILSTKDEDDYSFWKNLAIKSIIPVAALIILWIGLSKGFFTFLLYLFLELLAYSSWKWYIRMPQMVRSAVRIAVKRNKQQANELDQQDNGDSAADLATKYQLYRDIPSMMLENTKLLADWLQRSDSGHDSSTLNVRGTVMRYNEQNWPDPVIYFDESSNWQAQPIETLDNQALLDFGIIPQKLIQDGRNYLLLKHTVMVDLLTFAGLRSREEYVDILLKTGLGQGIPELDDRLAAQDEAQAAADAAAELEQQTANYKQFAAANNLPDLFVRVMSYVSANKEELGFNAWNLNQNGFSGSSNYLSMRFRLLGDNTLQAVKPAIKKLFAAVRKSGQVKEIKSDAGSFELLWLLGQAKSKHYSIDNIKADAAAGLIDLGAGRLGDFKVKFPRSDDPLFMLIGGLSRSGKSTIANRIIATALLLKTDNIYDYSDVYIGSVKDEDYVANGLSGAGAYIAGNAAEVYAMLQRIDEQALNRKQTFLSQNTINIKQYNKKVSESQKMGKILVVLDEYANTLSQAKGQKTDDGEPLDKAIERLAKKIAQEHGSRGVNMIVITQQFNKNGVGDLFDALGTKLLGYAPANVWNSIDNSQEMSSYMSDLSDARQGLFFFNGPDWKAVTPAIKFDSGFVEIKTHFTDTSEIRDLYDSGIRHFDTAANFENQQANASSSGGDDDNNLFSGIDL